MAASFLESFGGTVSGSFWKAPSSVDLKKRPGTTAMPGPSNATDVIKDALTLSFFFFSPNLLWFLLALGLWFIYPYPHRSESTSIDAFGPRLFFNLGYILAYYSFWHVSLYWVKRANRPFAPNRKYSWGKVLHNFTYTTLGIVQWTATEVAFLRGNPPGEIDLREQPLSTLLCCLLVPMIRDVHFYLAHRMIHIRCVYKYVHAAHHRTSDTEPFSGIAMHPTEHLYYFTCYGPLLLFQVHPFVFFWMGLHALISPAASHSGYEDHWGSDLYHYLHHRYFECNYAGGIPFDRFAGTFREKLSVDDASKTPNDPKATLYGTPENILFQIIAVFIPIWLLYSANDLTTYVNYRAVAVIVASAPLVASALLYNRPTGQSILAPFDKDSILSKLLHIVGGFIVVVLPAYVLVEKALAESG